MAAGVAYVVSISWGNVGPGLALSSFLLQGNDPGCLKVGDGLVVRVSPMSFVQCFRFPYLQVEDMGLYL